jgi:hypothetical protein
MFRAIFRAAFQPFSANPAGAAVTLGCVAGVAVAVAFRLLADRQAVRALRQRLWAHVLELRLFGHEPALAWHSLLRIAAVNALLVWHVLPPLAASAPVVAVLLAHLNEFCTRTPLQSGRAAVLTVRLRQTRETSGPIDWQLPSWIEMDAPPVRIPAEGEVSWRLRATAAKSGVGRISMAGESVAISLDSRPGFHYSGRVRSREWAEALAHPAADRLPDGAIERIWIAPDAQPLRWGGVTMPWEDWFAAAASLSAWLLSVPLARVGRKSR